MEGEDSGGVFEVDVDDGGELASTVAGAARAEEREAEGFRGFGEELFVGSAMSARTVGEAVECSWAGRTELIANEAPDPAGPTARIADIADAIRHGHPLGVTGEDGLAALRVSLAALESIETGRVISL